MSGFDTGFRFDAGVSLRHGEKQGRGGEPRRPSGQYIVPRTGWNMVLELFDYLFCDAWHGSLNLKHSGRAAVMHGSTGDFCIECPARTPFDNLGNDSFKLTQTIETQNSTSRTIVPRVTHITQDEDGEKQGKQLRKAACWGRKRMWGRAEVRKSKAA